MDKAHYRFVSVLVLHMIMSTAASIAVGFRFYARKLTKNGVKADDWIAVAASIFVWGDAICASLECLPYFQEKPKDELPIKDQTKLLLLAYISILFVIFAEVAARLSVILLYYRLFWVMRRIHYSLIAVGVLSIIWLLIMVFSITFECKPIQANFDASVPGNCLNNQSGFLISEILNMLLDIALLILPIPTLLGLTMPTREKVAVIGLFMTGGFVVITSIIRLIKGYHPAGDIATTGLSDLDQWTGLHLGFAVICCCLPVFRVYISKDGVLVSKIRLLYSVISGPFTQTGSKSRITHSDPTFSPESLPSITSWKYTQPQETMQVVVEDIPLRQSASESSYGN